MNKTAYYITITFFIILISIQTYKLIWGEKGLIEYMQYNKKVEMIKRNNEILIKKNDELKHKIDKLQTEKEFLEKMIRDKLDMIKENEINIKFKGKKKHENR